MVQRSNGVLLVCALVVGQPVAATAAPLPPFDGYPGWSPDGARIVFESTRDGNYEIYVMRADGSDVERLTETPAYDRMPSFSPDGKTIVFQSTRHSSAFTGPLTYQVYAMDVDGSNVRRLTHTDANDTGPRISPDGSRILFVSDRTGNREIHVMEADGAAQTAVTTDPKLREALADGVERSNPHWSADGTGILFDTADRQGAWRIFALDLEGRTISDLSGGAAGPEGERAFFASASPDGRTVGMAFDHDPNGNGNWEIWLRDGSDGHFRRLTDWWGNDFWQEFSPDGREMVFASDRDGSYALYRMPLSGGEPVKLTQR